MADIDKVEVQQQSISSVSTFIAFKNGKEDGGRINGTYMEALEKQVENLTKA